MITQNIKLKCEPKSDIIENYIYDAWGMHVSNWFGPNGMSLMA
jgi:hypothetical protein